MLVGPSGCGKTTAMRMVNRMIDITSGDIRLDGKSITTARASMRRQPSRQAILLIGLVLAAAAMIGRAVSDYDDRPDDKPPPARYIPER